ncbi:MAG TPA: ACP S-malonyltransferase [Actinomycetota bacterium]|nr:ACP S-malonyltransferase [Actinomycetota bacterium]
MTVAVVFPGQGSQEVGMADPWLAHPVSAAALQEASDVLETDIVEVCRDGEALDRTEVVQTAVFACDLAAWRLLESAGVEPAAVAGHSLGEFVALVAAGVIELRPALVAVRDRALAMGEASASPKGGMTALVGLSPEDAAEVCQIAGRGDVLTVANENSPKQTVLSGTIAAIERAEDLARTRGARPVRLKVAGAFHSPLMRPALQGVRDAVARLHFEEARFPVVPNVSGRPTTHPFALRDLLSRQLVSPVRWEKSMRAMADIGVTTIVEAGPGEVLAKLAKRGVPGIAAVSVGTPGGALEFVASVREEAV